MKFLIKNMYLKNLKYPLLMFMAFFMFAKWWKLTTKKTLVISLLFFLIFKKIG